jgi:cytochrome c oxidase assembly protein subunit 15
MTPDAATTVDALIPGQRALRASAWIAAALTLLLVVVGGLVTSLEVGMSVPDWPTTEGAGMFEAKQADLTQGQRVEHTHRLLGATVGCATLLVLFCALIQPSRRLKAFAVLATVMVITQGVLGGLRVTENSVPFAMVHAGLAQIFFSLLVCMAVASSRFWNTVRPSGEAAPSFTFGVVVVVVLFAQVLLGVLTRHLEPGGAGSHAALTHLVGAALTTVLIGLFAGGLMNHPTLKHLSTALLGIVAVQVGLGMAAWAFAFTTDAAAATALSSVVIATAHQAVGAVLLATTAVTVLFTWKLQGEVVGAAGAPLPVSAHTAAPELQFAEVGA